MSDVIHSEDAVSLSVVLLSDTAIPKTAFQIFSMRIIFQSQGEKNKEFSELKATYLTSPAPQCPRAAA